MTMETQEKHEAYSTHQRQNLSDREIEARALLSCARTLEDARNNSDRKTLSEAIQRNQRLWTIFQVGLCDPTNPLSHELKTILLNLSRYVDKISFRAVAEFKPALLASLIEINRHIAAGLSKKPETAAQMPVMAPALPSSASVATTA